EKISQSRGALDHLLQVVKQQAGALFVYVLGEGDLRAESERYRRDDKIRVADSGQWHPEDAIFELRGESAESVQSERGLAATTGPGDGDQSLLTNQQAQLLQLSFPANDPDGLRREIGGTERPERREALVAELEQLLWPVEILQPVQAEVGHQKAGAKKTTSAL